MGNQHISGGLRQGLQEALSVCSLKIIVGEWQEYSAPLLEDVARQKYEGIIFGCIYLCGTQVW